LIKLQFVKKLNGKVQKRSTPQPVLKVPLKKSHGLMKSKLMATLSLLLNSFLDLVPTVSLNQHPKMMLPLLLQLPLFGMPPLHQLVPGLLDHPISIGLLMEQLKKINQSLTGDALQVLQLKELLVQILLNHGTL